MAQKRIEFTHRVFNNDPILFKSYVNREVTVLTDNCVQHTGIVYTIDPVSESIVLIQPEGTKYKMKVILGHAVKNIRESSDQEFIIPDLFSLPMIEISRLEISNRKNKIKQVLTDNRLSFTEENDIIRIEDTFLIESPYKIENYVCSNKVISNRILSILSNVVD